MGHSRLAQKRRPAREAAAVAVTVVVVAAAGCTSQAAQRPGAADMPSSSPDPVTVVRAAGDLSYGRTGVKVPGAKDTDIEVAAPKLGQPAARGLATWWARGAVTGTPVEISTPDADPDRVVLTRSYPTPVPEGATATWVYFDTDLRAWTAAPSRLSRDRRTVTATVDHLSTWTDLVAGTQQAMTDFTDSAQQAGAQMAAAGSDIGENVAALSAQLPGWFADGADWLHWNIAGVLGTRVEALRCVGEPPDWVDETTFIEDNDANPVRWCVGHDPKLPDLLVVKARVNRGYGYGFSTTAEPDWTYNSTYDAQDLQDALDTIVDINETVGRSAYSFGFSGNMVGPGEEVSFGFSEEEVRARDNIDDPLVELSLPDLPGMLVSVAGTLAGEQLGMRTEGWVIGTLAVASCARDLSRVEDYALAFRAVLSCLAVADTNIAQLYGEVLLARNKKLDPVTAGKTAGSRVGLLAILFAVSGPVLSGLDYLTEQSFGVEDARQLRVFPVTIPGTRVIKLNPWLANGQLRAGWTMDPPLAGEPVACDMYAGPSPSYSGVSPNTYSCGTTADSMHSCWASPAYPDRLACLHDPASKTLVTRYATGLTGTPPSEDPVPAALELADGSRWEVRQGGAWGGRADGYLGTYFCLSQCGEEVILAAPGSTTESQFGSDGEYWTAYVGELGDPSDSFPPPREVRITRAWYIRSTFP